MRKNFFVSIAIALFCFQACRNDDDAINPPSSSGSNYTQLKVGNYWIYERYNLDTNGVETPLNKTDSSYVEKDTMVNSKIYYKLIRPNYGLRDIPEVFYLRDSLHYLIDLKGDAIFSSQDFSNSLSSLLITPSTDFSYTLNRRMMNKDSMVTVPLGRFPTLSSVETVEYMGSWSVRPPRYIRTIYADGIGVIYDTFTPYASSPNYTIQKLVRYKVN